MKKIISIGIISIFLISTFSVFVVGEEQKNTNQIILNYSFETPIITDIVYHQVKIEGAPCGGNSGEPNLPTKGVYILIPQGERVKSITVVYDDKTYLGEGYLVEPIGQPIPLSDIDTSNFPVPDKTIYSSKEQFPGKLFTEVGISNFKGYKILILKLHPVQYIPSSGELYFYPDLTVLVQTVKDGTVSSSFRELKKDEVEIIDKVDNSAEVDGYKINIHQQIFQGQSNPLPIYDLLIITTEELEDSFYPLKQTHDNDGLSTLIYTVEDIYNNYTGFDNAEKIRNFIIYAYGNLGVDYVLLGGDDDVVPARRLFVYEPSDLNLYHFPSDLYYAGLDGTWNKPENPKPSHKDISITDPGVSGSGEQKLTGPVVDYTEYVVGDSSMHWNCNTGPGYQGRMYLSFNPPIDISNKKWIQFKVNVSYYNLVEDFAPWVTFYDNLGQEKTCFYSFTFNHNDPWVTLNIPIIKTIDDLTFNFHKITQIELLFFINSCTEEDFIRLDGIYFSEFCDRIFGELDEEDLYAEVNVGRTCVDNVGEVNNIVNKTIAYLDTEPDNNYFKKVQMVGEDLGFGGPANWGGNFMDNLIGKCRKFLYTTQGFPQDKCYIDKLYDRDWSGNSWPKSELINRINNGVHIINHLGHGNEEHNMKMENPDIDILNNEKYCFIYSQACLSGAFDHEDCIAEHFTVKTENGAFAGIWNAEVGIGSFMGLTTDGISQRYHREFWDAVFDENITLISKANQDSKEDNIWRINGDYMRLCYYQLNYFGDPSIKFKYLDSTLINKNSQSSQQSQQSSQTTQQSTPLCQPTSQSISQRNPNNI